MRIQLRFFVGFINILGGSGMPLLVKSIRNFCHRVTAGQPSSQQIPKKSTSATILAASHRNQLRGVRARNHIVISTSAALLSAYRTWLPIARTMLETDLGAIKSLRPGHYQQFI
jgi:hypothetical protein